ncbi:hypothetical protein PISL3812_08260 [Talaromyces islandicus]|uniref:Uncharacterized protein n=1 Tax=Talaromyces islandicus TaxID=28573 RepID=A0A0U1M768_TALIS|nr:hypothetical protein PISL3812_08260 [Talaromyces islandicus]
MTSSDAKTMNEGEIDWENMTRKDWHCGDNAMLKVDIQDLEAENDKLRAEIEELKDRQNADCTETSYDLDFDLKDLPIEDEEDEPVIPPIWDQRRVILDEVYINATTNLAPQNKNPPAYRGVRPHGNIQADIEIIAQHGYPHKWQIAFFHMYGIRHEQIKDMMTTSGLEYLYKTYDIRGTVQIQLPFTPNPDNREHMEDIRRICDGLLSTTEIWSPWYWDQWCVKELYHDAYARVFSLRIEDGV